MTNGQTVHAKIRAFPWYSDTVRLIGRHGADCIMALENVSIKDAEDMGCIRFVLLKNILTREAGLDMGMWWP